MMRILISVLIPVHNAGPYLTAAVQSVLNQTFGDFELLIIDDGSSDGCLNSLASLSDPRLRNIRLPQCSGAPVALNTGLAQARGELIAFLDHDDLWDPRKLQEHSDWFSSHPECDLAFDWCRRIGPGGEDLGQPSRQWHGSISFEQLLEDFVPANTSAIVARLSAIQDAGSFNRAFTRVYDLDLCLRIAAKRQDNCQSLPKRLTSYRRHPSQMSRDWRGLSEEWLRFLSQVGSYAPRPVENVLPIADSNMRRYFAWLACETGDFRDALRLELSAFRRAPSQAIVDPRNWLILLAAFAGTILPGRVFKGLVELASRMLR